MKKTIALLLIAVMAAVALASCTNSKPADTSANTTKAEATTTEPQDTEIVKTKDDLTFISNGEMYFDINLSEGVYDGLTIKVGDKTVTSSGKVPYTDGTEVTVEGTPSETGTIYLIGRSNGIVTYVSNEIKATDLARAIGVMINGVAGEKTYIMISDKRDGFNHDLNADLTAFLNIYMTKEED